MPYESLFAAVAVHDLKAVDRGLEAVTREAAQGRGPAIGELVNERGFTLAEWAILHQTVGVLERLHAREVDLSAENETGYAPVHLAAYTGAVEMLSTLRDLGADMNAFDKEGFAPVHYVAAQGHAYALEMLCTDCGADPNARSREGSTPGHCAARFRRAPALRVLHVLGADLTLQDGQGFTPTHLAAQDEQIEALAEMIRCGIPLPEMWPQGMEEKGPQRVNQAAVGAAIAELRSDRTEKYHKLAGNLMCPVSEAPYGSEGPHRPVRWTDRGTSIVMSAQELNKILRGHQPTHPISGRVCLPEECVAMMNSPEFREGDAQRLAQVRAARDVMLGGGAQGRLGRLVQAAEAAEAGVPQWQRVLQEGGQRAPAGAAHAPGL